MPSSVLSHKSPFEVLFHSLSDFSLLKVFGCQCFPWLKPYTAHKLQPRSVACMFLGYHPTIEGYRCLEPITGKIYISNLLLFHLLLFLLLHLLCLLFIPFSSHLHLLFLLLQSLLPQSLILNPLLIHLLHQQVPLLLLLCVLLQLPMLFQSTLFLLIYQFHLLLLFLLLIFIL